MVNDLLKTPDDVRGLFRYDISQITAGREVGKGSNVTITFREDILPDTRPPVVGLGGLRAEEQ